MPMILWNISGLQANREKLDLLCSNLDPTVINMKAVRIHSPTYIHPAADSQSAIDQLLKYLQSGHLSGYAVEHC